MFSGHNRALRSLTRKRIESGTSWHGGGTSFAIRMDSKHDHVRALFEQPEKYLGPRQYDIEIRVEVVEQFTNKHRFGRVLDIGCGNGSISLPLLRRSDKLTLVDLSSRMLHLARRRVPAERVKDVELIHGDFLELKFEPASFDLICCIGVLAHVASPAEVVARIRELAKPGALVILEFTDSFHFWGIPVVLYQKILSLMRPAPYRLNRLRRRDVMRICEENGFKPVEFYRYGLPPLGSSRFLNQEQMFRVTRFLFGPAHRNRNAWMGNQFLYCLERGRGQTAAISAEEETLPVLSRA